MSNGYSPMYPAGSGGVVEELREEIRRLKSNNNKWENLSTAPRDGTRILISVIDKIFGQRQRLAQPITVFWGFSTKLHKEADNSTIRVERANSGWLVDDKGWNEPLGDRYEPTHWMPLPPVPDSLDCFK